MPIVPSKAGYFKLMLADWRRHPDYKNALAYQFTLEDRQLGGRIGGPIDASKELKVLSSPPPLPLLFVLRAKPP
jgi:hypothetical protein